MSLNSNQEIPPLLKRVEVAKILDLSVRTIDRLIEDGDLPASKIGRAVRIRRDDVLALLSPSVPAPERSEVAS